MEDNFNIVPNKSIDFDMKSLGSKLELKTYAGSKFNDDPGIMHSYEKAQNQRANEHTGEVPIK